MLIICRPVGRGNWTAAQFHITGDRAKPLLVKIGLRFEMAGVTWRVVKVLP